MGKAYAAQYSYAFFFFALSIKYNLRKKSRLLILVFFYLKFLAAVCQSGEKVWESDLERGEKGREGKGKERKRKRRNGMEWSGGRGSSWLH
jgi:hypothetical protein